MEVSHEKVLKKVDTTKNTVDILNDGKVISSIYEPIFKSLKDKEYILEKVQKAISNIKNKTFEINSILYPLKMSGGGRFDLSNNEKLRILNNIFELLYNYNRKIDIIKGELDNSPILDIINEQENNDSDLKVFFDDLKVFFDDLNRLNNNYEKYLNKINDDYYTKLNEIKNNLRNDFTKLKSENVKYKKIYRKFADSMKEYFNKINKTSINKEVLKLKQALKNTQDEFEKSIETLKNVLKNFMENIEDTIADINDEIEDNKNSKYQNKSSDPVQNKNSIEVLSQNRVKIESSKTKVNNSLIESILDDYEKKIQKAKNLDEKLKIDSYFIDKIDSYGLNLVEIFKINMNDKFSFIFFILLLHIIATSLIEFFIMNDYVTNLVYVIAIYIGIYIFLMILAVVILNKFTGYKAKVLLNYLNTDFNMDLIIIHLFIVFMFYVVVLILSNSIDVLQVNDDDDKITMLHRIEIISTIIFIFTALFILVL
jgi:HPt (histidine-containing phosphotransfer) domain-containing protein